MTIAVRLITEADTVELTHLLCRNAEFLAPWEPRRSDEHWTESRQRQLIMDALARHDAGIAVPLVITVEGVIVGQVNVSNIVGGVFQSAHLGYWVTQDRNGRGVASRAVAATINLAFEEYGLHRLEAATLLHNSRSQRVLRRNGFTEIGVAPHYLRIAGEWQDHLLFQRLSSE